MVSIKQLPLLLLTFLSLTFSYAQDFTVTHYEVDIYLHVEGYFDVVENYDLTFDIPKHGIYRDIQTKYNLLTSQSSQEVRKIRISNVKVPGHHFEVPFNFEQKLSSNFQIKIGDANVTVEGPQHYEIKYRVHNAFLYEVDAVKFYWNLKPSDWYANFNQIDFRIHLPESVTINSNDVFIYSGNSGITEVSKDIDVTYTNGIVMGKSKPNFVSYTGQSVTILINMPPNSITEVQPFWPFWTDYGWVFVIMTLLIGFYLTWRLFGKDDSVIANTSYYPPDGMDPAMAGFLINDADDASDLISLIPYWGSEGYLRIEEIPKKNWFAASDTKLIALKPLPSTATSYERTIFSGLFGHHVEDAPSEVLISSLKDKFYTKMTSARKTLKELAQPYYEATSKRVMIITSCVTVLLTLILGAVVLFVWGIIPVVAFVITGLFLLMMNRYMIKKNAKGNQVFSDLKGFRQFIKIAEANKLKMLIAENPSYFEDTMGYALTFGLFNQWAKKFDALNIPPPKWYSLASRTNLNMHNFSNAFANTMSSAKSTMVSTPKSSGSSGGGSSGGGFGGGGGGSW